VQENERRSNARPELLVDLSFVDTALPAVLHSRRSVRSCLILWLVFAPGRT